MLLLVATVLLVACHSCSSSWDEVTNLDTLDPKRIKEFISPLVGISLNAYFYPRTQPVSNWTLASKVAPLAPKQQAGAHALVYENVQEQKLVLAFRGTYTQADGCEDILLWGNDSLPWGMRFPDEETCKKFDSSSMDYISQAVNYTETILREYPGTPLLLTGHSLGAALAVLVSASMSKTQVLPVVAFSSPGTRNILQQRNLQLVAGNEDRVFVFADEWDAVVRTSWNIQVGTVCLNEYEEPSSCVACRNASGYSCGECIAQTHELGHILQMIDDGKTKLVCQKKFSAAEDPSLRLPQGADSDSSSYVSVVNILFAVLAGVFWLN